MANKQVYAINLYKILGSLRVSKLPAFHAYLTAETKSKISNNKNVIYAPPGLQTYTSMNSIITPKPDETATKVNQNFTEIYTTFGDGTNLSANAGSAGTWTKAGNTGIYTSKIGRAHV